MELAIARLWSTQLFLGYDRFVFDHSIYLVSDSSDSPLKFIEVFWFGSSILATLSPLCHVSEFIAYDELLLDKVPHKH